MREGFSSHHGLPNWGSTSLYGRGELQTAWRAWACATCLSPELMDYSLQALQLLLCGKEPRSAGTVSCDSTAFTTRPLIGRRFSSLSTVLYQARQSRASTRRAPST